jgi:alpha-methylacyl-CoA racemase
LRGKLEQLFRSRTRDEWDRLLEGSDVCYAPVLDFAEAPAHPHNRARENFIEVDGLTCPAPAPRFSRTPSRAGGIPQTGEHTREVLQGLGLDEVRIEALRASGAIV